jgi:hypothetical protein
LGLSPNEPPSNKALELTGLCRTEAW